MMGQDIRLPGGAVDVGIDFCSGNAFMTEHLLDDPEVSTVFYKMGRERMPESVR